MSDAIKKINWKIFLLLMLWTAITATGPVAILILDWIHRWSDPPDWTMVAHQAIYLGVLGAIGFWRKNKALLQLPPGIEMLRELQSETTTVSTIGLAGDPNPMIITKTEGTTVSAPPNTATETKP